MLLLYSAIFFFFFFVNEDKAGRVRILCEYRKLKLEILLSSSLLSLSKIKLFFLNPCFVFQSTVKCHIEFSWGQRYGFQKGRATVFIYSDSSWVSLKIIISDQRTFLHSECFCQNLLSLKTYQENLNIRKLWFMFSLEENATLEIIL